MPFNTLQFRFPWRPYQQRVLDAIDAHLDDKRLHIVAAPGAGKTTLGLEVFRRLAKTALVLSPTRIIRDQWIDRLGDFRASDDNTTLTWVSKNIHAPKTLTSITYQALHAQFKEEPTNDDDEAENLEQDEGVSDAELNVFIQSLQAHNIQVIILDEAHHLRAEWWRALDQVCTALPETILVSLTATPPYDALEHEWSRYEQLCGPIDEEISIPELVKAGTLCPHQDYIWAVDASVTERAKVGEHDDRVATLCDTLFQSEEFDLIVRAHPWLKADGIEQDVLKDPEIAMALLVYLKQKTHTLPKSLLSTLDLRATDIPELGRHWWQVLVHAALFSSSFTHNAAQQESMTQLAKQLRASELLHKRTLSMEHSKRLGRSLSLSVSKIQGCLAIHNLELTQRGASLRQVILTDYIRDEALVSGIDTGELNLGAWPIYRELSSSSPIAQDIALLTGRLSIIAAEKVEQLLAGVNEGQIKTEPLDKHGRFHKVSGPLNLLTGAFTRLLMQGDIRTLVGTRSLLGEGWDAPAINSLILASSVGSFMLTNQMRGRAIRIDKNSPDKISTIWHLVAIDTQSYSSGWSDFYELRNRFNTFVGLSEREPSIESGFDRMRATSLNPNYQVGSPSPIFKNNRSSTSRYKALDKIGERWHEALTIDESARIMPSVETPTVPGIRAFHVKHTLKYLLAQIAGATILALFFGVQVSQQVQSHSITVIMLAITCGMLYKLPQLISAMRILLKHLPVDGSLKQIGQALCESLCQAGLIESSFRRLKVQVMQRGDGSFGISISGGSFYESSLFADCLAEILAPIENPRYLVVREGEIFGMQRDDYHAVPLKLAVKKDLAHAFYKSWCKYVGPTEIIYSRTALGKERLVKARMQAFSSTFKRVVKRQDRWQSKL